MINRKDTKEPLVSIITPVYNAEKFIAETLDSILNQTYSNFEVICVDDLSTDDSRSIIEKISNKDERINYYCLPEKGGASIARNFAIGKALGKYIAFLDADDTWYPRKLELQIRFMEENSYDFTYTDFDFVSEKGELSLEKKTGPMEINYRSILKGNPIGCLTVIYNQNVIGKVSIERIDKRNDFALWLEVLKKIDCGYRYNKTLSSYRFVENSLSRDTSKAKLLKYHYKLFRQNEKMGVLQASYYTLCNIANFFFFKKYLLNKD